MVVSGVSIVGVNEGDVDPRSVGVNLEGVACFVVLKVWVCSVVVGVPFHGKIIESSDKPESILFIAQKILQCYNMNDDYLSNSW